MKFRLLILLSITLSPCLAFAQIDLQTHGTATQSSDWNTSGTYAASKGIDENTGSFTHTKDFDGSWWQLELDQVFTVERINITNRNGWADRMEGLNLWVYDGNDQLVHQAVLTDPGAGGTHNEDIAPNTEVKRIRVGLDPEQVNGRGDRIVTIAEMVLLENYNPPATNPLPEQVITEPVSVAQYGDSVVLYFKGFDVARSQHSDLELTYRMILADGTIGEGRAFDLTNPWEKPSIIIRKDDTEYSGIVVSASSGANVFFRRFYSLSGTITAPTLIPTVAEDAVIELGQHVSVAPVIPLPDRSQFPNLKVGDTEFGVDLDGRTLQVNSDINYPQVSSGQLCALSRQTDFPGDVIKRSLYVPLKSQLFDQSTGQPDGVAHYLCEIPLDPNWLNGTEDLSVNLNTSQIKVHRTDLEYNGTNILGSGGSGLGQATGTMDVDVDGNIYFSTVPSDVVRFNISTAAFEVPPVDLKALSDTFLPTDDDILGDGGTEKNGRWQTYRMVASMNHSVPSRMLYARTISKLIFNGTLYEWSSLFTLPTNWDDPVAFTNEFKHLVGSWPNSQHTFYDTLPDEGGPLRRIQYFRSYGNTVYAQPYPQSIGGPWRIDITADNMVEVFGTPETLPNYSDGAGKPVNALPYNAAAGGRIYFNDYGLLTMDRDDLFYCLNGTTNNSLTGQIEVSYDAIAYMLENATEFQILLDNMGGPSLAPSYMATHLPGQQDKFLGVGEYGYYLAEFDVSEATPGEVQKEFLDLDSPNPEVDLPLKVGLGPYCYQWDKIDDDDWLYVGGYTGLTRLRYSDNGVPLGRYTMHEFHNDLTTVNLDAGGHGAIKRFRWLQHGLDNRMFLTGTHTAARSGTAFSGGLLAFDKTGLDTLWKLSYMSRSYWTVRMRNRILRDADGIPRQEFVAKSFFDDQYALTIPPEQVPVNHDPKIFLWDYKSGGQMRDLMGFTVPSRGDDDYVTDNAYSNDRRYLILLQDDQLVTFDPQSNRFIDGKTLDYGSDIKVASYERPDYSFIRAPDDSLFLLLRPSSASTNALFLQILVSPAGAISVEPYFEVNAESSLAIDDSFGVQYTYLPDYTNDDGSYDLVLGAHTATAGGGTECRMIENFIPPRRHELERTLNILSSGIGGVTITGNKPGVAPYRSVCADGESVSLTAVAPSGYAFDEWQDEEGNVVGTNAALQIDMDEDRIFIAVFVEGTTTQVAEMVVSEIHYHPLEPTAAEISDGYANASQFEFIEVMNTGPESIQLSEIEFVLSGGEGIVFDFSTGPIQTLGAGDRVLVVSDRDAFVKRHGPGLLPQVIGEYTGDLSDEGETLTLMNGAEVLQSFAYDNEAPWPEDPGLGGFSLVLIGPDLEPSPDHGNPLNWRGSVEVGGSPGSGDALSFDEWRLSFGEDPLDPGSDNDYDGRSNLTEYRENTHPRNADVLTGFTVEIETLEVDGVVDRYFKVRVLRPVGADDLDISLDQSHDLKVWGAFDAVSQGRERDSNSHMEWLIFRSATPVGDFSTWFVKLQTALE